MARSQGSRMLARTGRTQDEVAALVGVSRVAVSHWITGGTKPGTKKRALLAEHLAIPESAWDEPATRPSARSAIAPPASNVASSESTAPSDAAVSLDVPDGVLAKAAELEKMAHTLMTDLDADPLATPLEKAKVMHSVASTLGLIAKLTGQFDIGARLFRLPMWKRIERALEAGLDGHPAAAAAVARELRKLEDDA